MAQNTNRWKLGLFVVCAIGIGVGAVAWLAARAFRREVQPVFTYFNESVTGLDIGSPVKYRGVTIGTVSDIGFADDKRHVEVVCNIYVDRLGKLGLRPPISDGVDGPARGFAAPPGLRAQLVAAGITGVRFIQFEVFDPAQHPVPKLDFETPTFYIPSTKSTVSELEALLDFIQEQLPVFTKNIQELIQKANRIAADLENVVADTDVAGLVGSTKALLTHLDEELGKLQLEAISQEARGAVRELRQIGSDARASLARLEAADGPVMKAVERVGSLAAEAERAIHAADVERVGRDLHEVAVAWAEVARRLQPLADGAVADLAALEEALKTVERLAARLERDPGVLLRGRGPDVVDPAGRD